MISIALLQILVFTPLYLTNVIDFTDNPNNHYNQTCEGFLGVDLPCFLFYSRFSVKALYIMYPTTLIIFGMYRLRSQLSQFVFFVGDSYRVSYEGEGSQLKVA